MGTGSISRPLPPDWYARPGEEVAPELLGAILVSHVGERPAAGRIVEVEAYGGPEDPASHAAVQAGRTPRNAPMFGPPGTAYLYLIYGMHWCFNVVTGVEGDPQAVLVRALEPLEGLSCMQERRGGGGGRELARGPGRLAQALGLDGSLNGHPLREPPLVVRHDVPSRSAAIGVSGRIGIRKARARPLRFFLKGNPFVSSGPHVAADIG